MSRHEFVDATLDHVASLAPRIRQADLDEIWAASRATPARALEMGMLVSRDPKVAIVGGRVECMFGIADVALLTGKGAPWLLGTDEMVKHSVKFLRASREYLDSQLQFFSSLENYVDARNEAAVKWLGWLGFDIAPAAPFGPDKRPFHKFTMELS
jgi:hypothetical protein